MTHNLVTATQSLASAASNQAKSMSDLSDAVGNQANSTASLAKQAGVQSKAAIEQAHSAIQIANGTQAGAEESKRIGVNAAESDRARLFIGNVELVKANDTDPRPVVKWILANLGRSAALEKEIGCQSQVTYSPSQIAPILPENIHPGGSIIAASTSITSDKDQWKTDICNFISPITPTDYINIANGSAKIVNRVTVKYRDIYGIYHRMNADSVYGKEGYFMPLNTQGMNTETIESQ